MLELLSFIGVFLAIEGALYAGAPSFVKRLAADIAQMDEATLRRAGLTALIVGVGLVWLVKS